MTTSTYFRAEGEWIDGRPMDMDIEDRSTADQAADDARTEFRFLSTGEQSRVRKMWVRQYDESGSVGVGIPVDLT